MTREEAFEAETLLHAISHYKLSKKQVERVIEIFTPLFDNERDKEERDKYHLSTAYKNFHPKKEVSKTINALSSSKTMFTLATEDLKRLNGEEQDILHALELTDLSLEELTDLTAELKNIRILRRVTKNFLEIAQPLHEFATHNEKLLRELQSVAGKIQRAMDNVKNRKYSVREKTALQEAFDVAAPLETRVKQ